jgi:hypothetical protein
MKWLYSFVFVIFIGVIFYLVNGYVYSSGVRSGKLVKLSKKGILLKTYEGSLDLGSGDKLTWDFSVRNPQIGEDLITKIGKSVELHYYEKLLQLFYKTKYDVYKWKIESQSNEGYSNTERTVPNESFCLFIKELTREPELIDKIQEFLSKRESVFEEKVLKCLEAI